MANRAVKARGLCATCYDRLWKQGALPRLRTASDQVLDVLDADGGWLTETAIHLATFDLSEAAVHKALFRLRYRGLVESRLVHGHNEWRLT